MTLLSPPNGHAGRIASLLVAIALVAGCATEGEVTPRKRTESQPTGTPTSAELEQRATVLALLNYASIAFEEDRLTDPPVDNAGEMYGEVLAIDPGNSEALLGRERIVGRYVELALAAAEDRPDAGSVRAGFLLDRAAELDPEHPDIAAARDRVAWLASLEETRFDLDPRDVSARRLSVTRSLVSIGARARREESLVRIEARSDAEARWIYQQLSESWGSARLRAEFRIAPQPAVVLRRAGS